MKNVRGFISVTGVFFIFLLFALASCGGGGSDTSTGLVRGTVTDIDTGEPLSGVTITAGKDSTVTDASGTYTLSTLTGKHTFDASTPAYLKTYRVFSVAGGVIGTLDWSLTKSHGKPESAPAFKNDMKYTILAWNDLGMHCTQDDFSYFLILPPFNTLHAQVIERGKGPVTGGITVRYHFPRKTDSARHTNFWKYAGKYGWKNLPENVGITGTPLAGNMKLDDKKLGWVAEGIPITPHDDDGTWDPYGKAVITVISDATGDVLQTAEVVAPVSTEMDCSNCHGSDETYLKILKSHDRLSRTSLVGDREKGVLHLCGECHADNALGLAGKEGVKNLSLAMHGFHKDKMNRTPTAARIFPQCYNCHPGPKTKCLRGIMFHAGKLCQDCHGDMNEMADSLAKGRQPWLEEPACGGCHGSTHSENPGELFRNSLLKNASSPKMNNKIYCEACHNSTHSEYTSTNDADNGIPEKFQGDNSWIWNCYVCHIDWMMPPVHR